MKSGKERKQLIDQNSTICKKNSFSLDFRFKISKLVKNLKKRNIDYQFVTACENNAWLLNIRGND